MTKKMIFVFCFVPLFAFAQLSDFQVSMLNSVDSLIIMTTNNTSTITTISSDSTYIISLAESIPPDSTYYQTAGHIIDLANHIDSMSSYLTGVNAQRYQNLLGLRETISNMSFVNNDIGNITNQLNYVCTRLDDIYSLFYSQQFSSYLYNIQADLDLIQTYTFSIDSDVESIRTTVSQISSYASSMISDVRSIDSKLDTLITDIFGIRYTLNRFYNSYTSYLESWLSHADHQDNFYYNTTNYLNEILSNLINSTNNDFNFNYDFTNILYSIYLDLASNTNILNKWKIQISRGNDPRIDNWEYYQPKTKTDGSYNGVLKNKLLGDAIMSRIYESLWSSSPSLPYDPLLELTLLNYYSDQALTASVNWQSLIHGNTTRLKDEIPDTLHNIATSLTNLHFQSLTATVPGLEILTNNVPIASLNHASWDWHMFFTNFYLYVSLGPENYNITNVGVSSSWHDSTNWFNRIEALLAALVFKDDNSGKVNTNGVSTSATESAVSDVTTSLRGVVEIDNSFSQNVSSSANTILDMLTEWTQQITASAQLNASFDMFSIPHMVTDDGQVHPEDSPASGDWAFRIEVQDNEFGDFIRFIRSLTTVLWLCVFMFFALKMSLFLLICICKFVYFCYVVFSAMMGGD